MSSSDATVASLAVLYLRARSWGLPAALVMMVAIGAARWGLGGGCGGGAGQARCVLPHCTAKPLRSHGLVPTRAPHGRLSCRPSVSAGRGPSQAVGPHSAGRPWPWPAHPTPCPPAEASRT